MEQCLKVFDKELDVQQGCWVIKSKVVCCTKVGTFWNLKICCTIYKRLYCYCMIKKGQFGARTIPYTQDSKKGRTLKGELYDCGTVLYSYLDGIIFTVYINDTKKKRDNERFTYQEFCTAV